MQQTWKYLNAVFVENRLSKIFFQLFKVFSLLWDTEPKENWLGFQQIDDTEKIYHTFPNWKLRQ